MSNKNIILSTLKPGSFFKANKVIARGFKSNNTAIVLAELLFKYDYFNTRDELVDGECFYCTSSKLAADCNVGRKELEKCIGNLIRAKIVQKEIMGLPAKTHYMINFDNLADFISKTALQANNGDSLYPGEQTSIALGEQTSILPGEQTNKEETSSKKLVKRKKTNDRSPTQIIIEEGMRKKRNENAAKGYDEELTILMDSDIDDKITGILDDTDTFDTDSMEIAHKALANIANLPAYYKMSPQDVLLMERVMESDNSSLEITYKLIENIAKIKSGKRKETFGQIFVGTAEMIENRKLMNG